MKKIILVLPLFLFSFSFFFFIPQPAEANILDDLINGVKKFLNIPEEVKKELKIDANITLAPGGDVNKNGTIEAGDVVRFSYTITNTTDKEYSFATLKTNIDRKEINFIHNVIGTVNLLDDGKTISITNLRLAPNQVLQVSFDARVNYFINQDPVISTQADFVGKDRKSYSTSGKKEIKAKRILKDKIPGIRQKLEE